jgi:serine phosphatase RsbU (regulator of sigma subunit)
LLDVVANNFETMQNSIITKIEALGQEIEIRKQAEHDLRTLNAELEQRVEERTLELATAYEEIQILNHQLQEENLRMCAELDVARRLQAMVLPPPTELEQIQGLDIVGYMKSADEVGGDYYDVLTSQEGLLHIGIGDVTGHGLESGVLMLMAQTTIRTLIDLGESDPVTFLNTLNRVLYQNIQRMHVDKSLTLSFVRYHDGQLKLIGQHEELLVVRHNGQLERVDTMNLGFPIGLEEDITPWIAEATVILESGDGVVLYTDGITEAENEQRKLYGVERLCDVISRNWQKPAEGIKQAVIDDVFRHIGQQQVFDDLTLVIMKQQ